MPSRLLPKHGHPLGRLLPWLIGCALIATGCVHRRLTIRSNPPGATVYVDDREIGTTPVSTGFTYYGTRKIRLEKAGYATRVEYRQIPPPWYQLPIVDFVAETLIPRDSRDKRELQFQLEPQPIVPAEQLLERAENLRGGALIGIVAPLPSPPAALPPPAFGPAPVPPPPPSTSFPPYPGSPTHPVSPPASLRPSAG